MSYDIIPNCAGVPAGAAKGRKALGRSAKQERGCGLMLTELKQGPRVAGVKQTRRAVQDGRARRVFLAQDADPRLTDPIAELCRAREIPVERTPSMKELGDLCGIAVGSAAAALLA